MGSSIGGAVSALELQQAQLQRGLIENAGFGPEWQSSVGRVGSYTIAWPQEYQASTGACTVVPLSFAAPPPEPDTALRWLDKRVDEMRAKL